MTDHGRRRFLAASARGAAAAWLGSWPWHSLLAQPSSGANAGDWNAGSVRHLLPTVSDHGLLLKASFARPLAGAPQLRIQSGSSSLRLTGMQTDTAGEFWQFYTEELSPATRYELSLLDASGSHLCDSWPLSSFPAPGQQVERARLLVYTCAGGPEGSYRGIGEREGHLPTLLRNRLLRRGLSFAPDAVIANGDHVYWDLHTWQGAEAGALSAAGRESNFDFEQRIMGGHNEAALKLAVTPQILPVYGTDFRSTPVFFLQDDHDHFENDSPLSYPVPWFQLQMARVTQQLYYPEFLADVARPPGLPWSGRSARGDLSESFGTLRYGDLVEVLLYDVRRTLQVGELNGVFLDRVVEDWLHRRTESRDTRHLVHMPSNPPGWTAGKWGEWYPDVLDPASGELTIDLPKPQWQRGWLEQHDRIMQSLAAMRHRQPLVVSGDLHATGSGFILGSGALDFSANPIATILSGPVGTSPSGFPSVVRNARPVPSQHLAFDERVVPFEQHGFTILDFDRERIVARLFKWDVNSEPVEAIDTLQPFHTLELA